MEREKSSLSDAWIICELKEICEFSLFRRVYVDSLNPAVASFLLGGEGSQLQV